MLLYVLIFLLIQSHTLTIRHVQRCALNVVDQHQPKPVLRYNNNAWRKKPPCIGPG